MNVMYVGAINWNNLDSEIKNIEVLIIFNLLTISGQFRWYKIQISNQSSGYMYHRHHIGSTQNIPVNTES